MHENMEWKATLTDEYGNSIEYLPYAFMVHEGEGYLILRAEDNPGMADEIIVLHTLRDGGNQPYELVEDTKIFADILLDNLGVDNGILN